MIQGSLDYPKEQLWTPKIRTALVIAMLGLIWMFSSRIMSENSQGLKWPKGSMETIFLHWEKGPMFIAGSLLVKSGL